MRHQMWMNEKMDEQLKYEGNVQRNQEPGSFPILSWYLFSAVFTVVVLFV